jgi:hypothetical protein
MDVASFREKIQFSMYRAIELLDDSHRIGDYSIERMTF